MSTLTPCPACHRHVRAGEACPFCGEASAVPPGGFGADAAPPAERRAEATLYGMPAPRMDLDQHIPAPHYGMPPCSPASPVFKLVVVTAVGGAVACYLLTR